jgi:hypothetical protein
VRAHVHPVEDGVADLRALSFRFAVQCEAGHLQASLASLLGGLRVHDTAAAGPDECRYALRERADGALDVWCGGEVVVPALRPDNAVAWLVSDVTRRASEAEREHLLIHAAGLQDGRHGILLPGPSGAGKSTLAAALVRSGLAYLTDELVALELESGRMLPYAKPISLKPGSFGVLGDMLVAARRGTDPSTETPEALLAVGDAAGRPVGTPCRPALLVFPRYEPGGATRVDPLSETEAFAELAVSTVNLARHGAAAIEALGALVAHCTRVALTMSNLDEAVTLVRDLVRPSCRVGG